MTFLSVTRSKQYTTPYRLDMSLDETTATAVQCSDDVLYTPCTECRGSGWYPDRTCNDLDISSQGPHCRCSELSLMPEQQTVWDNVRYLPGVRLRDSDRRGNRRNVWRENVNKCFVVLRLCSRSLSGVYVYLYRHISILLRVACELDSCKRDFELIWVNCIVGRVRTHYARPCILVFFSFFVLLDVLHCASLVRNK